MPGTLTVGIRLRRSMTEEIDVDGLAGQTPQARDGLDGELRVHGCAADRAEAAGIRDRGREFDRAKSCHRGQHNRMFDLKQFEETYHRHRVSLRPLLMPQSNTIEKDVEYWEKNRQITISALDEDFIVGEKIFEGARSIAFPHFVFGRNELGISAFHESLEKIIMEQEEEPG